MVIVYLSAIFLSRRKTSSLRKCSWREAVSGAFSWSKTSTDRFVQPNWASQEGNDASLARTGVTAGYLAQLREVRLSAPFIPGASAKAKRWSKRFARIPDKTLAATILVTGDLKHVQRQDIWQKSASNQGKPHLPGGHVRISTCVSS